MNQPLVFTSGERYGRLTGQCKTVRGFALYKCDCGQLKLIKIHHVHSGATQACGCMQRERSAEAAKLHNTRHGLYRSPTHFTWTGMLSRCRNPFAHAYENYGGRGITVCSRWEKFENFLDDMGVRPTGTTLDRKDNELGYFPENCRWATKKEQGNNTRTNVILALDGKSMTVTEWADKLGVSPHLLYGRIRSGWPVERVLTS